MQTDNYKARAHDVRRTARAHLAELRKARLAQRDVIAASVDVMPKATDAPAAETDGDLLEDLALRNAAEGESEGPSTEVEPVDEIAAQDASEADAEADAEVAEDAPTPTPGDDAEWRASPLAALPGAGPGLIWVLGQCGVHTLEGLAAKDADQLTEELGVIGQILDVPSWIEFAQAETPVESAAVPTET